jgi:hypothetical protein
MFTAAPDCTKISIDTQIVRHTCAPLFTAAETGLSSKLSSTGQRHSRSLYHFFFESRRSVYPKPRISDPAEGAEAAVDRNHDAVYEVGGWAAQPNQGADEFLGLAKTAGAGVLDYRSASLREAPILIQHVSAGCNLPNRFSPAARWVSVRVLQISAQVSKPRSLAALNTRG